MVKSLKEHSRITEAIKIHWKLNACMRGSRCSWWYDPRKTGALRISRNPPQASLSMDSGLHLNDLRYNYLCSHCKGTTSQTGIPLHLIYTKKWSICTVMNMGKITLTVISAFVFQFQYCAIALNINLHE